MVDLKINGQSVDLPLKRITRKIQIGEVGDLGNSKSSFSYSVVLPYTDRNRKIFRGLTTSGNVSRIQYEDVRADLTEEGIPLVNNGKLVFRSAGVRGYSINILDGVASIVEIIGNKSILDLDLSRLDHTAIESTLLDSYSKVEGYIYGMGLYGGSYTVLGTPLRAKKSGVLVFENGRNLDFNPPSIFLHTIFQKILDENGISFRGNMFDINFQNGNFNEPNFFGDESFYSEIVAPSKGIFLGLTDEEIAVKNVTGGSSIQYSRNDYDINISRLDNITSIDANLQFDGASGFGLQFSGNSFSVNSTGLYYVDPNFEEFETSAGLVNDGANFSIFENGIQVRGRNDRNNIKTNKRARLYRFEAGVNYTVGASYNYKLNEGLGTYQLKGRYGINVRISSFNDYKQVSPQSLLKDIGQLDFLRDVLKRYGWQLIPDKFDNTKYEVVAIQSVLGSRDMEDWTDKLVGVRTEKYKSNYSRFNSLSYGKVEGAPNLDSSIIIEDENLKFEGNVLTSIINIPLISSFVSGDNRSIYRLNLFDEDNEPEEGEFIVYKKRVQELGDYFGDVTFMGFRTIELPTEIVVASRFEMEMEFFKNKAFSNLEGMLNNYKEISAELKLNVIDIYNLDFTKLKFFRQFGRRYLLNTVNYTSGQNSICEIVEVTDLRAFNDNIQNGEE